MCLFVSFVLKCYFFYLFSSPGGGETLKVQSRNHFGMPQPFGCLNQPYSTGEQNITETVPVCAYNADNTHHNLLTISIQQATAVFGDVNCFRGHIIPQMDSVLLCTYIQLYCQLQDLHVKKKHIIDVYSTKQGSTV